MQKNFHIGKFFERAGGGVYVWILLHARLELNAPSSYGLLSILYPNIKVHPGSVWLLAINST